MACRIALPFPAVRFLHLLSATGCPVSAGVFPESLSSSLSSLSHRLLQYRDVCAYAHHHHSAAQHAGGPLRAVSAQQLQGEQPLLQVQQQQQPFQRRG
jgi:hypothetical protein